ncbi:MAG TPA: ABC transporter substrate-binding protein [Methylomirabilota bacterium]|jgi:NitT/TauT family transport system substrate-binding protein|nr:ABC transporter substrate-binding protein [Methylomirabilota bacterium]
MHRRHLEGWSRREFLGLTLAGTAGLLGLKPALLAAELPLPETTTLRLARNDFDLCLAPQYVAEQLLRDEGFTDVRYIKKDGVVWHELILGSGEADISMALAPTAIIRLDAGDPIVFLGGGHIGCFELLGSERVRSLRDLKGKTVAVFDLQLGPGSFIYSMAAYVGLSYEDINWVMYSPAESLQLLAAGKIDAFLVFPPAQQELRAKRVGHVHTVVDGTLDKPWSQYFCCIIAGNREFVRKHPVATKRAVRAILKGADLCGREPERAAQLLMSKGYTNSYEILLQALKEIPYDKWREYNPEDTVRFYALRLHESGMIKSTPQKIIAEGTDWRFWNELKQELQG